MNKAGYTWLLARIIITILVLFMLTIAFMKTSNKFPIFYCISYIIVFLISGIYSIYLAFTPQKVSKLLKLETIENRMEPLHLLMAPFIFICSFILLCSQIHFLKSGLFIMGTRLNSFPIEIEMEWIIFGIDQVVRAVLLDVFETYHIDFSVITYADIFWLETIIFIFKSTLTVYFWKFIISSFKEWKSIHHSLA